jgi:anti-sigma B factor antagonist
MTFTYQISVERGKEVVVMYLKGRIDLESSPLLRNQLLALLRRQDPPGAIVIDLAETSYLDTSGIATLVEGLKTARIRGIEFHLEGLRGRLLHLLQSTGIATLFDASETASHSSAAEVS